MDIKTYRKKKNEVHTPEKIKAAFDTSYAVCFDIKQKDTDTAHKKRKLFGDIWTVNPDVIITEADLCIMSAEPIVMRDQFLLINKNGTKETSNEIARLMSESGIIKYEYRFLSETKARIKRCYGNVAADSSTPSAPYKSNLLVDGDKLLITARVQTKADRAAIKQEESKEQEM